MFPTVRTLPWMTCVILLMASLFASCATAAHLKRGHTQRHHVMKSPSSYLSEDWDHIYAVCVFNHGWVKRHKKKWLFKDRYTIGFFDRTGNLLKKYCAEEDPIKWKDIEANSKKPDDWTQHDIDDDSVCFLHKDEAKEAQPLMVSWDCESGM